MGAAVCGRLAEVDREVVSRWSLVFRIKHRNCQIAANYGRDMKIRKLNKKWTIVLVLIISILILAIYPSPEQAPIKYVDRENGMIKTEKVPAEKWLVWLYNNPVGEATLWTLVKRKMLSSVYGKMMDSPESADKIPPFVEEYNIDLSIAKKQEFNSFNDFFTRELKQSARPVDTASNIVVSPADGKIMAWADISNSDFIVKGYRFDVQSFLEDTVLAEKYIDGSLIVIRLGPTRLSPLSFSPEWFPFFFKPDRWRILFGKSSGIEKDGRDILSE